MLKKILVFILLFTGYLCNAQSSTVPDFSPGVNSLVPAKEGIEKPSWETTATSLQKPANETQGGGHIPAERSLPTLVVAGVSIALVLLCILIVAIFWYAWKKSQEGSMQLNPIPYGEAVVSVRNPWVPESQQEWPSERAVP